MVYNKLYISGYNSIRVWGYEWYISGILMED